MRTLAGIAILAAACGNDNVHHLADSGTDAPPDVAADGPSEGTVTLTIIADGSVSGVPVHFQNADSSLVATVPTDASGVASASMAAGGFVTAVSPFNGDELFTFAGVKPGDQLHLDLPNPPPTVSITVDAPIDPAATNTLLFTTCGNATLQTAAGSGGGPVGVTLSSCSANVDMVVESFDGNFAPLQALFQPDVAVSDGAAITLTASYQALATTNLTLAGFGASTGAFVQQGIATAHGLVYPPFQSGTSIALANGTGSGSVVVPDVTGGLGVETIDLDSEAFSARHAVVWGPYSPVFAVAGTIMLAAYTSAPAWDPAANAVTYTIDAGTTPDFEQTTLQISAPTNGWTWHMVAPHATALTFPHIPVTNGTDFNPAATDFVDVSELTAAKVPGGYDAARALAFDIPVGVANVSATTGDVVFEDLPRPLLTARPAPMSHVPARATRQRRLLAR
jgi:hypothetical protein